MTWIRTLKLRRESCSTSVDSNESDGLINLKVLVTTSRWSSVINDWNNDSWFFALRNSDRGDLVVSLNLWGSWGRPRSTDFRSSTGPRRDTAVARGTERGERTQRTPGRPRGRPGCRRRCTQGYVWLDWTRGCVTVHTSPLIVSWGQAVSPARCGTSCFRLTVRCRGRLSRTSFVRCFLYARGCPWKNGWKDHVTTRTTHTFTSIDTGVLFRWQSSHFITIHILIAIHQPFAIVESPLGGPSRTISRRPTFREPLEESRCSLEPELLVRVRSQATLSMRPSWALTTSSTLMDASPRTVFLQNVCDITWNVTTDCPVTSLFTKLTTLRWSSFPKADENQVLLTKWTFPHSWARGYFWLRPFSSGSCHRPRSRRSCLASRWTRAERQLSQLQQNQSEKVNRTC